MSEADRQTRAREGVRFVIEIEVRDAERFKAIAARCVDVSRTEPGTLVYDWYLDEETGRARLYEAYESLQALRVHSSGPVFTEVGPPLMEVCTFVHVDAFGDVGDMAKHPTFWPTTFWGPAFASVAS
jgi:quinol monooxygenase YgiN